MPPEEEEVIEFDNGEPLFNPASHDRLRELTNNTSSRENITISEESLDAVLSAAADAERDQHVRPDAVMSMARPNTRVDRRPQPASPVTGIGGRRAARFSNLRPDPNERREITMSRDAFRNTISAVMDSEMAQASVLGRRQREEEPDDGTRGVNVFADEDDSIFGPREDDDSI